MMRKIRMVFVTLYNKLKNSKKVSFGGVQDLSMSTTISIRLGKVILGKRTKSYPDVGLYVYGGELIVGDRVSFNRGCMVACRKKIRIGNSCAFGPNTIIYDHDHMFDKNGYKSDDYKTSPVVIEDNCWIGANVIILRGSYIGEGSVIGAGTIVKGRIPPHSLVYMSRELVIKNIE